MKRFLLRIINFLKGDERKELGKDANISLVGSWRLMLLINSHGIKQFPRWKEVWSFAAMDNTNSNGIYACDFINLHTIIGKWELENNHLRLVSKECESEYILVELPNEQLILKPDMDESKETLIFQRVV